MRDGLPPAPTSSRRRCPTRRGPIASSACRATRARWRSTPNFRSRPSPRSTQARDDEARKSAAARVRADVGKHVKDIAERYLLPGETQDIALMFVPSESIYADLVEHFDDVVQKAHRARVVIVSPSLLMMAIQVTQTILRDARMRDQAHAIQAEVGKLLNDVRLLAERAGASSRPISVRRRRTSARSRPRRKRSPAAPAASTRWSSARKRPRSRRRRTCGWRRGESRASRRGL